MKINKAKIKLEYRKALKNYHRDIDHLDPQNIAKAIKCASDYYNYLAEAGIPYARLALDVIENQGKFGQLANIHLKSQSLFEGIQSEAMPAVREKIIISLAAHDAKMRSDKDYNQSNPSYKEIEQYHIKVFKYHTSPYAWGGLALRELINSGSWMKFYEDNSGILQGITEIIKQGKIGGSLEYSAERMLKSVDHSHRQYTLESDTPFELMMSTGSKEQAALIWKIDANRISEIEDDTSMLDSVSSKIFKAVAAKYFVASGEFDYSSSDSEGEDEQDQTLLANKVINKQLTALLSNPSDLKNYQQESLDHAMQELKFVESFVPNITKASLDSKVEHYEFMQQLMGIKDPGLELQKMQQSAEAEAKIDPYLKELVQSFQPPQTFAATNIAKFKTQEPKADYEDNDWLNTLLSNTSSMMNDAANDPDMQQFIQNLGKHHEFNSEDHI